MKPRAGTTGQPGARQGRKGEPEKYGARGHGSMARGGIQRVEVADDHNTRIPGHHPRPVYSSQRAGAHR